MSITSKDNIVAFIMTHPADICIVFQQQFLRHLNDK